MNKPTRRGSAVENAGEPIRRPNHRISGSSTGKPKHDYPDKPENRSLHSDDVMGALHNFSKVVQTKRARRHKEEYEEVAEAYQYAVILRDSAQKWARYVNDKRWVGIKGRPKAAERPDALQSVIRLVWGVLQDDPDASSLRYRAVRKFWADGVAPNEITRKIDNARGFRKLTKASKTSEPPPDAAAKQHSISNQPRAETRPSKASNAVKGRRAQPAKAMSQVKEINAGVTLKGNFFGPWGHLRCLTMPVVLQVTVPGSKPIRFRLDALQTE